MVRNRFIRLWAVFFLFGLIAACMPSGEVSEELAHSVVGKHCSACHAPPTPKAHTANEWPSVVTRMQQHRYKQGKKPLTEAELHAVIDYLVKNK